MTGSSTNVFTTMIVDTTHVLPGLKNSLQKMSPSSSDDDEPRLTNKSSLFSSGENRLYDQQQDDDDAPISKLSSKFFGSGVGMGERRSCPSEKSFMLSSSSSKLPFSNDRTSRQHNTSNAADVAVQKIGCLMNTWKHEREGDSHKTQERYSEPSISCTSPNTLRGTETSSFSKLSALCAVRHERASSHGSSSSDESRTRVLNVLGRASEIIKSIDTTTTATNSTTETADAVVVDALRPRPREGVRQQRRLAVFNLCDTIMMEDEEEEEEKEVDVEEDVGMIGTTDEEEEPQRASFKTNCGFRLSEPRIMNKQPFATGGSISSCTTTARDVIDLLERHHAAAASASQQNDFFAFNTDETRQLSSSSASSCGSTSSNTSLREPDEMISSVSSSSTTMSY